MSGHAEPRRRGESGSSALRQGSSRSARPYVALLRASVRHYARHPLQLALAVLGVALGVAVVTGVDIASSSARVALGIATQAVSGRATHYVVGGPLGLPDSVYSTLRVGAGIDSIAPIVEGVIRLGPADRAGDAASTAFDSQATRATTESHARTIRLLGIDAFAEAPFRSYVGSGTGADVATLVAQPGALLLPARFAASVGVGPGDSLRITAGGIARAGVVAGILEPADPLSRRALEDLAVADIATAQELLGGTGRIDRIDVIAGGAAGTARLDRLAAALPAGARIVTATGRAEATADLSRAFEINLTALGLLALVFGAFLIYNSIRFAVVQRRALLGLLRAQGVTRREVVVLVIAEAAGLGVIATAVGLVLGAVLGRGLVGLVARTINDLYFRVAVSAITVEPATLGKAALLGVGATVVAGLGPAREAARVPPHAALSRASLETRARGAAHTAAIAGLLLLATSLAMLRVASGLALGFASLFGVIFAAALLTPAATTALMALATRPAGRLFGLAGRIAVRGVRATLSRTAPAIAALTVAIAVGAAVGLMIAAFRASVEDWLDTTLQADAYVSAPSSDADRSAGTLDPDVARRLVETPGVAGASRYRRVALPLGDRDIRLSAVALYAPHRAAFTFLDGDAASAWRVFDHGGVLVSEPFANRTGAVRGGTLRLPTDRGRHSFTVGGVFRDYASEHGVVFMDRATYDAYWDDPGISSLGLFADAGLPADTLVERLRARADEQELFVRSDRGLRDATLMVFDRTFAITAVLRLLALAVAFVGVLAALMALQLDRARELGVLRAIGVTPGGVRGLVLLQTALIGLTAGVLAVPLGAGLAWLMIEVINRRAFGWSVAFSLDTWLLAQAVLLALAAALLAGIYPAARMARTRTAAALRDE